LSSKPYQIGWRLRLLVSRDEYLEHDSVDVADRFIASAFSGFDEVAAMPGRGSPKHFTKPSLSGVRSWADPGFPNHLIYYKIHPDAVIILGVLHGAGDVESILERRNS